ncbi:ATP-binding protein [Flavobacteriaceae bacterium]|nr:ATP-binding protein [Flavobacteriaceae bacterium]
MNKMKLKGISLRFRIFIYMILMVVVSSILLATLTLIEYNSQSEYYDNERLERKQNQLKLSLDYVIKNSSFDNFDIIKNISHSKIEEISEIQNIEFKLYDLEGNLLKNSDLESNINLLELKIPNNVVDKFKNQDLNRFVENNVNDKNNKVAYEILKDQNHRPIGILYISYDELDFFNNDNLNSSLYALGFVLIVIIVISTFFAYFLSRYITKPLFQISNRLKLTKLSQNDNKIILKNPPKELAELVNSYNLMIDELENSAIKLAKSERENAWREMAKQVAHEIKNPLTPMRLTIQSFQKNFNVEKENINLKVDDFSNTLIQQIDVMSSIASAFSDFAKMPAQKKELLDLKELIESALDIFDKKLINFSFDTKVTLANLDKSQLIRVLTNLVKNAIQAVPNDRTPIIDVYLSSTVTDVIIKISDNGSGIDEDNKLKIFEPRFTTKSSGMGLGLPIINNIIKSFGGTIEFETKMNIGTTFTISLPKN